MRLRFTIRDLLWLTALLALAVGWWLDHARLAALTVFPNELEYRHIQASMKVQQYERRRLEGENRRLKEQLEQVEAAK